MTLRVPAELETYRDLDTRIDEIEGGVGSAISVRAHGAIGTGETDESLYVQDAFDAVPTTGGAVYFPPGLYIVNNVQPRSGTAITGPGVIKQKAASVAGDCAVLVNTGVVDVVIDSLEIDGNVANQTTGLGIHGIRIAGQRVIVKGCHIHDCTYNGVSLQEGAGHVQVLGNRISTVGVKNVADPPSGWGHGVNGEGTSTPIDSVLVEGNIISDAGQHGVRCGYICRYWTVQGNHMENVGHDGWAAYDALHVGLSYVGNVVQSPARSGCHLGGTQLLVSSNTIRNTGDSGVGVLIGSTPNTDPTASTGATITGNHIYGSLGCAIETRNFSGLAITGNRIDNSGVSTGAQQGIFVQGTYGATTVVVTDIAITGNQLKGTRGAGIQVGAATDYTVNSNMVNGANGRGIRLVAPIRVAVTGNTVVNSLTDGIFSDGTTPSDVTVSGNVVLNNGAYGVRNNSGDRFIVSGNIIRGNTTAQLGLTGTNNVVDDSNDLGVAQSTTNSTNASFTLTPFLSSRQTVFTAVLTNTRTCTLSTTNAQTGMKFRLTRTAASTGAFNIDFGGLKNIAVSQWAEATFDGSAWVLTSFGSL